jgi:hypothetical protein
MEIIKGNLYKSKNGVVVMAIEKQENDCFSGQVIVGNEKCVKGFFSDTWAIDAFQPYSAEIIIKEVIDFSKVQFIEMESGDVVLSDGDERNDKFVAVNIKTSKILLLEKSEAKRVVTANFKQL